MSAVHQPCQKVAPGTYVNAAPVCNAVPLELDHRSEDTTRGRWIEWNNDYTTQSTGWLTSTPDEEATS